MFMHTQAGLISFYNKKIKVSVDKNKRFVFIVLFVKTQISKNNLILLSPIK